MGRKKLSELVNLEIINIQNGEKYGYLGDSEMIFNNKTGEIMGIIVSEAKSSFFSFKEDETYEIPWASKIKQSDKTLIFDYKL